MLVSNLYSVFLLKFTHDKGHYGCNDLLSILSSVYSAFFTVLVIEKIILAARKRGRPTAKRSDRLSLKTYAIRKRLLKQRYKFSDSSVFGWISRSREDRTSNSLHESEAKGMNAERTTTIF